MKSPNDTEAISPLKETINKTGFVLEHKVASLLERHNWVVIHNRYYLDDVSGGSREMDILAYKVTALADSDIRIFTALIISCKKSDEHDWAFLTRNAPGMNLNLNLLPVNFYSNQEIFNFIFANISASKDEFLKKYDSNKFIVGMYN